jgi:large subunit ribosomal protein L25
MKTVSLSGSLRESVGKKDAKKNRREGKIPCVLYGGKEQVAFTLGELDFNKLIFTGEVYLLNLDLNGKQHLAILQDVQYHPVTDKVLHADFLEVKENKPITIKLPVEFFGDVPGVIAGGRLIKKMRKVIVRGLASDMPDYVKVDMSKLNIGDNIKIKDLKSDGLAFLDHENAVVVLVKAARGLEELETEEEEEGEETEGAEGTEGEESSEKEQGASEE